MRHGEPLKHERTSGRVIYDRLAARYDPAIKLCERLFLANWRERAFANLGTLRADTRLLEIGAGTGANFACYAHGTRGVAGEISRAMIEIARDKPRPADVHLVQHRAEELPFADDAFDAALATLVFCSVASPARAFAELRRVVCAGGRMSMLEHVRPPSRIAGRMFDLLSRVTVPLCEDHFNRQTARDAGEAGLIVERIEPLARGVVQLIVCRVEK